MNDAHLKSYYNLVIKGCRLILKSLTLTFSSASVCIYIYISTKEKTIIARSKEEGDRRHSVEGATVDKGK